MMNPSAGLLATPSPQSPSPVHDVPRTFRAALTPIYERYLAAGEALARSELSESRDALKKLGAAVKTIEAGELESDVRRAWREMSNQIAFAAYEAQDAGGLAETRREYQALSAATRHLAESFGHVLDGPLLVAQGPGVTPALEATWLQSGAETKNPYTGGEGKQHGRMIATLMPAARVNATPAFYRQLSAIYDAYLALHSALARDKAPQIVAAAQSLSKATSDADGKSLDAASREVWGKHQKSLLGAIRNVDAQTSTDELRTRFEPVSLAMVELVDAFGHARGDTLYKVYCPMAFESPDGKERGAPWLQIGQKVENPYRTDMPRCGEIQRPFKPTAVEMRDER
jgi:hypothetical protein